MDKVDTPLHMGCICMAMKIGFSPGQQWPDTIT